MSLATEIINGQHDGNLDAISEAIRERRQLQRISVGDHVLLSGLLCGVRGNPNGMIVKVVSKRGTTIKVKFLNNKDRKGEIAFVPAQHCMRV